MSKASRKKTPAKTVMVRTVCLALAGLMLLSVVMAAVWHW